jgi:AcrR family transcriptional regulator
MRQIASAAGVSKPLLYHYFPSKKRLFQAAVSDAAAQLLALIEPAAGGSPAEQLTASLDAYLAWIEANARTWTKLMQSAAALPEAQEILEGFRTRTMEMMLVGLTGSADPSPALRTAVNGWLGFMDAAILDWTRTGDLTRVELRELLLTAFGGADGRSAARPRAAARARARLIGQGRAAARSAGGYFGSAARRRS